MAVNQLLIPFLLTLFTLFFAHYVLRAGIEPARTLLLTGFSYLLQLSLLPKIGICGLDYIFTMIRYRILGTSRLVSTPSPNFFGAWLGITILKASPTLRSSTSWISPRALKFFKHRTKSCASTYSAIPAIQRTNLKKKAPLWCFFEQKTGFEPATSTLARSRSTS